MTNVKGRTPLRGRATVAPHHAGGGGFTPGHWRADKPTGRIAIPEGPPQPVERPDPPPVSDRDGRPRDPRTAVNLAERAAALAPRRFGQ